MCTLATGKKGKHWYEYRYAASSLGTLSPEFLRKFAWAVGGAAGQKGGGCDEHAGSQHCDHEMDQVWCEDSYVTRPTVHPSVQRPKRPLDCDSTAEESMPVLISKVSEKSLVPGDDITATSSQRIADARLQVHEERHRVQTDEQMRPDGVVVPPMKVIWPSDLQIKGMERTDDESTSQESEPEWVRDVDVGRRIRQSFLLNGADNALSDVANEIEPLRAEQQRYREGSLSHAKVLSCHLCSNASTAGADDATPLSSSSEDHNLAWLYIGSANLSAAAWGRPLHPTQKHYRDAAAGALDSAAVRRLETTCATVLCVWGGGGGGGAQSCLTVFCRESTIYHGGAEQGKVPCTSLTGKLALYCGHRPMMSSCHS